MLLGTTGTHFQSIFLFPMSFSERQQVYNRGDRTAVSMKGKLAISFAI